MYQIFIIHSSVDRHLGLFHFPAIVNGAATKMGMQISRGVGVGVFEYKPRSEMLWHIVPVLIFEEPLISMMAVLVCTPDSHE